MDKENRLKKAIENKLFLAPLCERVRSNGFIYIPIDLQLKQILLDIINYQNQQNWQSSK